MRRRIDPEETFPQAGGYSYRRPVIGKIEVTHPGGNTTTHDTDLVGYGLYPASLRHPGDVPEPLYHGTPREIPEGSRIEPGHPGNFVSRMRRVYATDSPEEARKYAGASGTVYQVRPTGWYGHRRDARGGSWASNDPFEIVGKHDG